jgi:hypothetical protein
MVRLDDGVSVPHNVEAEPLCMEPPCPELVETNILVLIRTEANAVHTMS